jgi:hypothetical protein
MAKMFKEKETGETRLLPSVSRTRAELHGPLDSLGVGASHLRLTGESTRMGGARAIARAAEDMAVARNISNLRLEGSVSVRERFQALLTALR